MQRFLSDFQQRESRKKDFHNHFLACLLSLTHVIDMKKFSQWVAKNIAFIVLSISLIALFIPNSFNWIPTSSINPLLGVVMFGMGLTMKPTDFKVVFTHPKDICIGAIAQFSIMPLLALVLCKSFNLPTDIALGVILVGCCPGGTASNVYTYLSKGDIALSVGMTGLSTLLAPFITPALVLLLAGKSVDINPIGMFESILQVVILPIILGFLLNRYFKKAAERLLPYLPMISTMTISLIVACIISLNAEKILECSLTLMLVIILHNGLGLILGYGLGKLFHLPQPKLTAISIEVGMQNSGLATSLATTHFATYPLATIPGAIFSVWHNISGAIATAILKKIGKNTGNEKNEFRE